MLQSPPFRYSDFEVNRLETDAGAEGDYRVVVGLYGMDVKRSLPESIRSLLREADASLFRMVGESHHLVYRCLHATARKIARTDAFYITFYSEDNVLIFPYTVDEAEFQPPQQEVYAEDRLAAWMLKNRKPYWSREDEGELLRRGSSFGDRSRLSVEAIAVPIFALEKRNADRVVGILCIQSYEPDVYTEDTVRALEWLANSVAIVFAREREEEERRRTLEGGETQNSEPSLRPESLIENVLGRLASIRRQAQALLPAASGELLQSLEALCRDCAQHETETMELYFRLVRDYHGPFAKLSEQERKIVALLAEGFSLSQQGYTNRQIAAKLFITEDTVKTHLKAIYKKLGISGRAGVAKAVSLYFPQLART